MNLSKTTKIIAAAGIAFSTIATASPAQAATTTPVKTTVSKVKLDKRCMTGRVVCIDKSDRKMYWVVNGKIKRTFNTRLGRKGMETKEGVHKIYWKHKNHVSSIYKSPMPYSQFFYQGQAIHQNPDWARSGYGRGSHGCANLKTIEEAKWLYNQTRVGDKVVVTK